MSAPALQLAASVVINSYKDDQQYLQEAIQSYLTQKGVEVQVIVSTLEDDPCIDLIGEQFSKDPRITLVVSTHTEHPGRGPAGIYFQLNKGLEQVCHPWYAYGSGNDIAFPTKLVDEITCCLNQKKEICYSAFYVTNEDLSRRSLRAFHPYSYAKNLNGNFVSDCALVSKRLLDTYGPFDPQYENHAYWDFWLKVYESEGDVFAYNPTPEWLYRSSDASQHILRAKDTEKAWANRERAQRMISDHLNKWPPLKRLQIQAARKYAALNKACRVIRARARVRPTYMLERTTAGK